MVRFIEYAIYSKYAKYNVKMKGLILQPPDIFKYYFSLPTRIPFKISGNCNIYQIYFQQHIYVS